jgi:ribulose-5-phosphate 4-epimerase/fuculose-1-phosphate aldolase
MPAMTNRDALIDDLVAANRILAGLGVLDGFGHVSARDPDRPERYLLSRSLAPERVTREDVMSFDLASNAQGADTRAPYLERFIHGAIYARRADVHAVVHSHAPAVVPFAASSVKLMPVYHMSSFLRAGAPVFEIRERFGTATDMLIRTGDQGEALAEALGRESVVLMRGHGYCAVGETVAVAVFRAHYAQLNADVQQRAIGLGGAVTYLDAAETFAADETNRSVIGRVWDLWRAKYHPRSGA